MVGKGGQKNVASISPIDSDKRGISFICRKTKSWCHQQTQQRGGKTKQKLYLLSKFEWPGAESKRACLSYDQQLSVNVCCVQKIHLIASDYEGVLSRRFQPLYFDKCSRDVFWPVSCSLDATCSIVFMDPVGKLCMLDVTIKCIDSLGLMCPMTVENRKSSFRESISLWYQTGSFSGC